MKSKTRYLSTLGMQIHGFDHSTPEYCILGTYRGATIAMVSDLVPVANRNAQTVSAALVMYQRARKISNLLGDPTNFSDLAELQLEAYVVAMNALSLLDQKNAWIAIPVSVETGHEVHSPLNVSISLCSQVNSPGSGESCQNTYQRVNTHLESGIWRSWTWLTSNTNTHYYRLGWN
jgi:hypothetical protein